MFLSLEYNMYSSPLVFFFNTISSKRNSMHVRASESLTLVLDLFWQSRSKYDTDERSYYFQTV